MDVTIDTYLARVVDTITTTAAQPQGWRSLQAGFRAAVLDDAKACVADQHDPAWRSILDAAAAEQAQADASAESGVERDAAGAGLWDELRSMLVFESEQVCAARSLSVWTTRSKPQYLLAGNMRDAQEVAPHLIRQLVIAAAVMQHHADVSVSVYESNSQDATGVFFWGGGGTDGVTGCTQDVGMIMHHSYHKFDSHRQVVAGVACIPRAVECAQPNCHR